ncbi:UNVERIFIED_CONTAM: hypothetical protein GTU68_018612 [Idotea baltica]|nr:hypothetical protein [Idotea baltica]
MSSPWLAALSAIFLWWFSTGAILVAVKRADRTGRSAHVRTTLWGLPLLILGMVAFVWSLNTPGPLGVYTGFVSALLLWGWVELAFLSGVITGPNKTACPPHAHGAARFEAAVGTILYHEGLLISMLLALLWTGQGAENTIALWTFGLLFVARISAKLNLFFGVPRINVEFLPTPLAHLPSYFRNGSVTALFPLSITLLSFATALSAQAFRTADTEGASLHFALLTTLAALALLEHWLMVLPLPDAKLWRWLLPAPKPE